MIVTVDEVKTHLRIQHDEEDACIEGLIQQAQAAAGHTTAAMTLKYYVKGRSGTHEATSAVERAYGIG